MLSFCSLSLSHTLANTLIEAENAAYSNCTLIVDSKYSGGKALEITEANAQITFSYEASEQGKYDIYVGYDNYYGDKNVNISVNGSSSTFQVDSNSEKAVGSFFINKGTNAIVITPNWTWFRIDYIRIETNSSSLQFDISDTPVDANATENARKMYTFLYDNFGKKTISGMMTGDMGSANGDITQHTDIATVYQKSGKYPALIGFDFMNATGLSASNDYNIAYTAAVIELVKDTYRRGGLPAFTWHWRDPSRNTDAFYTSDCSMKISDALNADGSWNTSSALYSNIVGDIDTVADLLLSLQDEGIACIFRPLHECSGGWFWWGREGADSFVKLFHLIYDELVNVKGVHNVIWVWNSCLNDEEWNPGNEYYDIVALDIYNDAYDYSSNYVAFDNVKTLTQGKKIIALAENGPLPDVDKEFDEGAVWSWWMPWYQTWNQYFADKTSNEEWVKCMNDPRVITLDDLTPGQSTSAISTKAHDYNSISDYYDLQGRRLHAPSAKGIYLRGGKKVMVK